MLARLDELPGVEASRVDWTGRLFLLELEPGADVEAVVRHADAKLGGGARRLDAGRERTIAAGHVAGTSTWMRAGETLKLSRTEAGILARKHGEAAAREAGLPPEQTGRLIGVIERETFAAFERIHAEAEGLPADYGAVFRTVLRAAIESSRAFLTPEQCEAVERALERSAGG